ncbi:MAG: pilus assembly protein [Proteobacteria bacterium]|nr:pilus assembly protein [Pseudomonadota bacterium]
MKPRSQQRGIALVTIAIAMLAVIAMAGLAIDISHVTVNKSRMQSAADAAALSAAKILDTTGSTSQATAAANSVFSLNAANTPELSAASGISKTVEYSNSLLPFAAGTNPPRYVRVTVSGFSIAATLSKAVGMNNFNLAASAVAGPSPAVNKACNVAPVMMCGTSGAAGYGYTPGQITALKLSSGSQGAGVGPGNYRLLSLGGTGGNIVRQNLAGSYGSCSTTGTTALTQPGNQAGPVAQGLNTRFNEYSGGGLDSATYPPDVITYQPTGKNRLSCSDASCATLVTGTANTVVTNASQYGSYSYEGMYQPRLLSSNYDVAPAPGGIGVVARRVIAVPVGDCSVEAQGRSDIPVLGLACVFLLQDVDQGGNGGQIFGEILSNCQVNGTPGPAPNNGPGPYLIQLYHVDGSPQS